VIVIYNPASKKRIHQLQDTRKLLLKYRPPSTPVAIVKGAYRESQEVVLTDLENMEKHQDKLGMDNDCDNRELVHVQVRGHDDKPRGYTSKYDIAEPQSRNK